MEKYKSIREVFDNEFIREQILRDEQDAKFMLEQEIHDRAHNYFRDKTFENLTKLFSCLRISSVYFLKWSEENIYWKSAINNKSFLFVFTNKVNLLQAIFGKRIEVEEKRLVDVMNIIKKEKIRSVLFNPFSEPFSFSVNYIKSVFGAMDKIVNGVEKTMRKGLSGKLIDDLIFNRFLGRQVYCETITEKKVTGIISKPKTYCVDGQYLIRKDRKKTFITIPEIKFIKLSEIGEQKL